MQDILEATHCDSASTHGVESVIEISMKRTEECNANLMTGLTE